MPNIPTVRLVFLLFLVAGLPGIMTSQNLVSYAAQSNFPGARAAGFADAFVSDAYDVSSMYWNPSALAYLKQLSVVVNHSQEKFIHAMEEDIAVPLRVEKGEAICAGASINHVGDFGTSSETDFHVVQYSGSIAYAKEIFPSLSVGALAEVQYGRTDVSKLWAVSSSIGILYFPDKQLSYGASFSGIGSGMLYTSDQSVTTLTTQNLPRILRAGATMRFPAEADQSTFILSVSNEKVFGESGIRYNGGLELRPVKFLALRGGYIVYPNLSAPRFGMGVRLARVEFDSAISPSKLSDQASHFSIAIDF
jgi:hypothetical protein